MKHFSSRIVCQDLEHLSVTSCSLTKSTSQDGKYLLCHILSTSSSKTVWCPTVPACSAVIPKENYSCLVLVFSVSLFLSQPAF